MALEGYIKIVSKFQYGTKLINPAQISCLNIRDYISLPNMIYIDLSTSIFMKKWQMLYCISQITNDIF